MPVTRRSSIGRRSHTTAMLINFDHDQGHHSAALTPNRPDCAFVAAIVWSKRSNYGRENSMLDIP